MNASTSPRFQSATWASSTARIATSGFVRLAIRGGCAERAGGQKNVKSPRVLIAVNRFTVSPPGVRRRIADCKTKRRSTDFADYTDARDAGSKQNKALLLLSSH